MSNPLNEKSGLPRFDVLKPEHAVPALTELIAAQRQKLDTLLADENARSVESLVVPLEEMSHELNRLWSPIGHLQSVLEDPGWRDAYNESLPLVTEYGTEISQNKALQQAWQAVADALPESADPAVRTLIEHELREFRLAGVALPDEDKERFKAIRQELALLRATFDQNLQDATDAWQFSTTDPADVAGIPDSTLARAREMAEENGDDGWRFSLDFPSYLAVMTHCDARHVREHFYRAWATRASDQADDPQWDNSSTMEQILALRHEMAGLVGFDDYAAYSLATKMAADVDEVTGFLEELAERSRPAALREWASIEKLAGGTLEAWDVSYYQEKLQQEKFSISNEALREYFPATAVLEGMFGVAESLYGLTVRPVEHVTVWHDTVRYFELENRDGKHVGGFYADLYARSGKRGGAWMDECLVRKRLKGEAIAPAGYLVCNFPPPDADGVSLLTHTDVVTLFHEFGHMLHHLLTRVDYPTIAGINGVPWDAVELPSQFMENFAWSFEVLEKSSAHVATGEPLPRDMFDRLAASRYFGEGLSMLRQLEFALFDMRLHAGYDPAAGGRVLETVDSVRRDIAVVQHPDYNRQPHSFVHIFAGGYAAGYYSYKWAEVLAADAFAAFQEAGVFCTDTAERFRREILEIGGSRDFMEAYVAFRGRKPTLDALLRQSGLGTAA